MKSFCCLCLMLISLVGEASSGQPYIDKFMTYIQWSQQLPNTPNTEFITFIDNPSPLTHKLREKWLYQLARNKDWVNYSKYYQQSSDLNLQCYEQTALYQQGQHAQVIKNITPIWLRGYSQPNACNELFNQLLTNHEISNELILQRIALALESRNLSLAIYLLKQHNPSLLNESYVLTDIHKNPTRVTRLKPGSLHSVFYLYGLKLLVLHHMDLAIRIWEDPKSKIMMSHNEQQSFLAYTALYKAMRNQDDAEYWLSKVKPAFYTEVLLDWEIRYAIAHKNWQKLVFLIEHSHNKDIPAWQYWLARAYSALGENTKSTAIYQTLGSKRQYYGFLANLQLNKSLNFENEPVNTDIHALDIYKPIIDHIKDLYTTHQFWLASRWLNDFSSELPKDEKSALAHWVAEELHWNGKSVYLGNNDELNNQLSLRFPLAYREIIETFANRYQVEEPLIYAMIRQESTFFDDIVSSAGANGLMQIMPITAKVVAKIANIPYTNTKELFLSKVNINIGVAYLKQLSHQYHAHPVLMVAAYNAGPRQVNYWLKNHKPREIDIWIETLPWQETRNYIKNVISFYAIYQFRLKQKVNLDPFMKPLI